MEKTNPDKNKPTICPRCKGNGYFTVKESVEKQVDTVVQCPMCKSQGELDGPNDDVIITSSGMHKLQ